MALPGRCFRFQAESCGMHPDRSLCPFCGAPKRGHVCRWAWPVRSKPVPAATPGVQPRGGSARIQLSQQLRSPPDAPDSDSYSAESREGPAAEGWLSEGPHVGERVLRRVKGHGVVRAAVRLYLPPGDAEDEPALWRIEHDDGDSEDLEEHELREAKERLERSAAAARTRGQVGGEGGGGGGTGAGVDSDAAAHGSERPTKRLRAGAASAVKRAKPSVAAAPAAELGATPAEAEGLRLHVSTNATGYKGVYQAASGANFRVMFRAGGAKLVHLGFFDTAVEAAVAYARAVGEAPGAEAAAAPERGGAEGRRQSSQRGCGSAPGEAQGGQPSRPRRHLQSGGGGVVGLCAGRTLRRRRGRGR